MCVHFQYDPDLRVRAVMTTLWNSLLPGPAGNQAILHHFHPIMLSLIRSLESNSSRVRQSACSALTELLNARGSGNQAESSRGSGSQTTSSCGNQATAVSAETRASAAAASAESSRASSDDDILQHLAPMWLASVSSLFFYFP